MRSELRSVAGEGAERERRDAGDAGDARSGEGGCRPPRRGSSWSSIRSNGIAGSDWLAL